MEAITAVGLASNVLQFFEFTTRLIRVSNELRNNAASSENKDYQVIATHLGGLAQSIKDSAQAISQASATSSSEEKLIDKALEPVVDSCCELAKDLLGRLKKCGIQPGQNASRFQRAKVAFKAIWSKKEIEEILTRLQLLKSEINLHYIVQIKKTQLDQQVRQPTIDDIQAIGRQIDSLRPLVGGLKRNTDSNAESQHPEIVNSIAESPTENSQMHAQAAQQALASRIDLSGQLYNSQSSMTNMNTSLENMQSRQSETYESIARVRIQNSTFFARATQQVPLSSDSGASFHNVIRPLFEEYFEKALTEMKKEYRTAARSQADHLLKDLLPTLHEMQSGYVVAQGTHLGVAEEDIPEAHRERSEMQDHPTEIQNAEPLVRRQLDKNNLSVLYQLYWRRKTKLGIFSLTIWGRVRFDLFGHATKLYELTAQFVPSPCWFATGCSMTYEYRSDPRGSPGFGLKFKTYGVLEHDHGALRAIRKGDVSTLQSMLTQRLISPSDMIDCGTPLLHLAMTHGDLDICKALVRSGANVNAYASYGASVLEIAMLPHVLLEGQGRDILHYLLGLPEIETGVFWGNYILIHSIARDMMTMSRTTLSKMQEWASVCRFVELDFNIPDYHTFIECVLTEFSSYKTSWGTTDRMGVFDEIIQQRIGFDRSADTVDIPVAIAASKVVDRLRGAHGELLLGNDASSILSVPYRGHYAAPDVAKSLEFLEYVISMGISNRPDCIFDTFSDTRISDMFRNGSWEHIWVEILEEHGFNVDWVYKENERRKRVGAGDTSAHEVSVSIDASAVRDVRRRRGYENSNE